MKSFKIIFFHIFFSTNVFSQYDNLPNNKKDFFCKNFLVENFSIDVWGFSLYNYKDSFLDSNCSNAKLSNLGFISVLQQ